MAPRKPTASQSATNNQQQQRDGDEHNNPTLPPLESIPPTPAQGDEQIINMTQFQILQDQLARMTDLLMANTEKTNYLFNKDKAKGVDDQAGGSGAGGSGAGKRARDLDGIEVQDVTDETNREEARRKTTEAFPAVFYKQLPEARAPASDTAICLEKIEMMERTIRRMNTVGRPDPHVEFEELFETPFTARVDAVRIPKDFQPPNFQMFDGRSDPLEHLRHYRTAMIPKQIPVGDVDGVMCKIFPSSLKGAALSWFDKLKPNTINSFTDLANQLLIQFDSCRRYEVDMNDLGEVKQERNETIRCFLDRFMAVKV